MTQQDNIPLPPPLPRTVVLGSYAVMLLVALVALLTHLILPLFFGTLVFLVVHNVSVRFERHISGRNARIAAVASFGMLVVAIIVAAGVGLSSFIKGGNDNAVLLFEQLAGSLESIKPALPIDVQARLPHGAIELKEQLVEWIKKHGPELGEMGKESLRRIGQILIAMIIGSLVAVAAAIPHERRGPLAAALRMRLTNFGAAFADLVFSQMKISAINTTLTALYLLVILPGFGVSLPYTKTLILITFIVGLLPVLGNLISNSINVLISLSVSWKVAVASLCFLIFIHKLEYFINARIIGGRIGAAAWELLTAMLVMEAVFGPVGVVAAPVYYAYLKRELRHQKLI